MPQKFDAMRYNLSYQPDYSSTWRTGTACRCAPASYGGIIPYFDPNHYPEEFVRQNSANAAWCQRSLYEAPQIYSLDKKSAPCLNTRI
jgi:hypothetical protein